MKKILAIFVLALFVAGMMPVAFAEDTAAGTADTESAAADGSAADAPARGRLADRVKNRLDARENLLEKKEQLLGRAEKAVDNRQRLVDAKQNLLEQQKNRVTQLAAKCESAGKTKAECARLFANRLENVAALAPKFMEKLQQFEANRDERIQKFKELKDDKVLGKFEKAKNFRARVLDKARIAKTQAGLVVAKERFFEAKVGLDRAKVRLEQAKTSKICDTAPDSEECTKAKDELRASAKEKLSREADMILNQLAKLKERVEGSEYISDEESARIITYVDGQIQKFTDIKASIDAAQTRDEIVAAAKELDEAWKILKHRVNAYLWHVANLRVAGILVKAEHLSAKLERVIERMAENGKDTSAVEPLVAEFKASIGLAKEKFKAAREALLEAATNEALTEDERSAKVSEGKNLLDEARAALKDANAKLREIFMKLKEAGATTELAAATEAEDVELAAELATTPIGVATPEPLASGEGETGTTLASLPEETAEGEAASAEVAEAEETA